MKNIKLRNMVFCGVFAAIIAVFSLISIPLPSMVPITLQTFIIAFAGFYLGSKLGTVSVLIYILIGAIGLPVFSGFRGGLSVLTGVTGGFIFGFIFFVIFCGIKREKKIINILFSVLGLAICHILGVLQYAFLTDSPIIASFILVSLPYLLKDIISIVVAKFLCIIVEKRIKI